MYKISQLAELLGLSRTTLLYYEKLGLIKGQRMSNGYRSYGDKDLQRLKLLQNLQAGGLTLKECQSCLDEKIDRALLKQRLSELDQEIEKKQKSRDLLAALLGESRLDEWHSNLNNIAPDAHLEWLIKQGFDEKQAMHLKWLSKDMNEHERYMQDFMRVFEALERWGPGSEFDTDKALGLLPDKSGEWLEIGCGQGIATKLLASHTDAHITAIDNDQPALNFLDNTLQTLGLSDRVTTVCADMGKLPFQHGTFDVIWAECSAYIIGVENALKSWRKLLKPNGILVVSDLVWRVDEPSQDTKAFWQGEYPDMTTATSRVKLAQRLGYEVVNSFPISDESWDNYYQPLSQRIDEVEKVLEGSSAIESLKREVEAYQQREHQFDYQMFILRVAE
ncbi:MerR family transcriptional regulator [Vibrio ouci]|uniref:MerR family transcriptional regulator n=1 Tax=Vibrio ouci TaxID=2499078 RepID=A0A4Y8WLS5_9VIBR|nr:methyltransferase domain-containing protein [Vibrio ouci]TFH93228.1 MerR family transcriptional regulator [Vibrio ouci]